MAIEYNSGGEDGEDKKKGGNNGVEGTNSKKENDNDGMDEDDDLMGDEYWTICSYVY